MVQLVNLDCLVFVYHHSQDSDFSDFEEPLPFEPLPGPESADASSTLSATPITPVPPNTPERITDQPPSGIEHTRSFVRSPPA